MEQEKVCCGTAAADAEQAAFERVWRRVMPEPRSDCPFTLYGDERGAVPAVPGGMPPAAPAPAAPAEAGDWGREMQSFLREELEGWRACRALARRLPGRAGRTMREMGEGRRRSARRLYAAYFLLSGVRFWPEREPMAAPVPAGAAVFGELRRCCLAQRRCERAYRAAAERTADAELRQLYEELARERAAGAAAGRRLLEEL